MLVRGLVFDIFGTVVDWRTSVAAEVRTVCGAAARAVDGDAIADAWRRRYQPSLERVRNGSVGWRNLDQLHRESLDEVLDEHGLASLPAEDRERLTRAWHRLHPWPDAVSGLTRLRTQFTTATLSNGNFALLTDLVKTAGLPFDCIISTELFEAYKPDPRTYLGAARLLGLAPAQLMMVAAHPDDLQAAAACGLRTAYVDRPLEWGGGNHRTPTEGFDILAANLEDLADQLTSLA